MISTGAISSLTNGFFSLFPDIVGRAVVIEHASGSGGQGGQGVKRGIIKIKSFLEKNKKSKGKITIFSFNGVDLES